MLSHNVVGVALPPFITLRELLKRYAIKSLVSAWKRNCIPINTEKAAKITGTYLPDVNKVLKNAFVHPLTSEELKRFDKRMERLKKSNKHIFTNNHYR